MLPLPREEIGELFAAAKADWKQVEPAIFGTLLEQALNPAERRKFGAHYTPRAYVERVVLATVLEPLKAEWTNVQAAAGRPHPSRTLAFTFKQGGKAEPAIARVLSSLARLGHVYTVDGSTFALRRSS